MKSSKLKQEKFMKKILLFALVFVANPAFADDISAAQLAQIVGSPKVVSALNTIGGGGEKMSVSAEPMAGMDSSGVIVTITVENRTTWNGRSLGNCEIVAIVLTPKNTPIDFNRLDEQISISQGLCTTAM
jgi:hypothetical protein